MENKLYVDSDVFTDNNLDQRNRYKCPECKHLLTEAVQTSCGHWLCSDCALKLFTERNPPLCPRGDCGEVLVKEDGKNYFPDKFVRKEIGKFEVKCKYHGNKCPWTGLLKDMEKHLRECEHILHPCPHCQQMFSTSELEDHKNRCPKAMMSCPFARHGCEATKQMTREECDTHLKEEGVYHSKILVGLLEKIEKEQEEQRKEKSPSFHHSSEYTSGNTLAAVRGGRHDPFSDHIPMVQTDGAVASSKPQGMPLFQVTELETMRKQLATKDSQVRHLQDKVQQLEATILSKTTENEDRDFRLSLMENSNYDGTMLWKIPQFSQRREDATTGKYTSIFSLPFYSGRYGYKMCLRLYILGDGIGKGTHMSLFFVLMKGEFDNILQWPFNHKVTFKLINQCGGRDVVDVFQPDPLSSSFQKPKTDMNIASGCPRFISLHELVQNGFIVDDTVFIKVKVDTTSMKHP